MSQWKCPSFKTASSLSRVRPSRTLSIRTATIELNEAKETAFHGKSKPIIRNTFKKHADKNNTGRIRTQKRP